MSTVLLAGGAGFIGSNLARKFGSRGDEVIVLERRVYVPASILDAPKLKRAIAWDGLEPLREGIERFWHPLRAGSARP